MDLSRCDAPSTRCISQGLSPMISAATTPKMQGASAAHLPPTAATLTGCNTPAQRRRSETAPQTRGLRESRRGGDCGPGMTGLGWDGRSSHYPSATRDRAYEARAGQGERRHIGDARQSARRAHAGEQRAARIFGRFESFAEAGGFFGVGWLAHLVSPPLRPEARRCNEANIANGCNHVKHFRLCGAAKN